MVHSPSIYQLMLLLPHHFAGLGLYLMTLISCFILLLLLLCLYIPTLQARIIVIVIQNRLPVQFNVRARSTAGPNMGNIGLQWQRVLRNCWLLSKVPSSINFAFRVR